MHKKMKDSPGKSGHSDPPDPDHRNHPQRFGYDRETERSFGNRSGWAIAHRPHRRMKPRIEGLKLQALLLPTQPFLASYPRYNSKQ